MIPTQIEDVLLKKFNLIDLVSSSSYDVDWLIFEILTRLPVKTLVRFKAVSKRWCSLIRKDQNFIHSYLLDRSRLRRLFIINLIPRTQKEQDERPKIFSLWDKGHDKESYITADLMLFSDDKGDALVDTVREVDSTKYNCISNPVNGLICQIQSYYKWAVRIYNISTRELSPWFDSSLYPKEKESDVIPFWRMRVPDTKPKYQLGFDPITNEHKLVCAWNVYSEDFLRQYLICDVLTVGHQGSAGDNRWRRIEEIPEVPYHLGEDSVYANGVIYWSGSDLNHAISSREYCPVFLVAFDIGREKFRKVTVSRFILDQTPPEHCFDLVNLLEVSGRLAMLVRMNHCMFKMYIYEDDDYKMEEEINETPIVSGSSFSSNNNGRWRKASSITLPFNLGESCFVRFCKFVGTDDEIIITLYEGWDCDKKVGKKKCVSFYSYNWKKGSWREFELNGIPSTIPHLCNRSFVTTFSENLLPVNDDKALF